MKYLKAQEVRIKKIVNKHTVDYHPILSELTSRIHPLIFLWTPKGFIFSPECFLIFSKPVFHTMVVEKFQIHGVKITGKCICESKCWIYAFLLMFRCKNIPQVFIITSCLGRRKLTNSPKQQFLYFSSAEREEDYGAEKMTKIKLAKVLLKSFDKFHHFCNLYIFGFCSVVL